MNDRIDRWVGRLSTGGGLARALLGRAGPPGAPAGAGGGDVIVNRNCEQLTGTTKTQNRRRAGARPRRRAKPITSGYTSTQPSLCTLAHAYTPYHAIDILSAPNEQVD